MHGNSSTLIRVPRAIFAALLVAAAIDFADGLSAVGADQVRSNDVDFVRVSGARWVARTTDGRELTDAELAGVEVEVETRRGALLHLRLVEAVVDPIEESTLYRTLLQRPDGQWSELCVADHDGRRLAVPIEFPDGSIDVSCTSGALAKCVRFGYQPWARAADGASLEPIFNACVRMVRADYCGDGHSWTREGVAIDLEDTDGVRTFATGLDWPFEAGWTAEGAVCVHRIRVPDQLTVDALGTMCPALKGRIGAVCSVELARSLGALLLNRSP